MNQPSTYSQILDYLSKYIQLQQEEVAALMGILQVVTVDRNYFLMEEGKMSYMMAFILKGCARSYYMDENGLDKTLNFHFENELMVSLRSFFGQYPAECSTIALEPMELLIVHYNDFNAFLQKFPHFESIIKDIIRDNIPDIGPHVRLLQIISAKQRYQRLISMRPDIIKRVQLRHIASYLSMTIETLSRVRGKTS